MNIELQSARGRNGDLWKAATLLFWVSRQNMHKGRIIDVFEYRCKLRVPDCAFARVPYHVVYVRWGP